MASAVAEPAAGFLRHARVWVPVDTDQGQTTFPWRLAKIAKDAPADAQQVKVLWEDEGEEDGEPVEVRADTLQFANPDAHGLLGAPDMAKLSQQNEPSLLHNLLHRFKRDDIYTYTGPLVIAINPFKKLKIYTETVLHSYMSKRFGEEPPHAFAVGEAAYRSLIRENKSQSIIISGESGAGKTETTKFVMQYIAAVGGRGGVGGLEAALLESNPLLEAFGNARTNRNNNSSRFGKFIEIQFDSKNQIAGGRISHYLLEKSRVVGQAEGERSFHIFYQLCAGASAEQREALQLGRAEEYRYLRGGRCFSIAGVDDAADLARTLRAMRTIGLAGEEVEAVLRILAAVLHLGNVEFEARAADDASVVANPDQAAVAAGLLGVAPAALEFALCKREIKAAFESFTHNQSVEESVVSRDALAKAIYVRLFDWLVGRVNEQLRSGAGGARWIGILDIFGFEVFERNSFEQLCINYCNEKLQLFFNAHMFKLEQEEYAREAIDISQVAYRDNQPAVDLFEKPMGLLALLDEECLYPGGGDASFVRKLLATHKESGLLQRQKYDADAGFGFRHFAGEVLYTAASFLDKNRDLLPADLISLMRASRHDLTRSLFHETLASASSGPEPAPGPPGTPGSARASFAGRPGAKRGQAVFVSVSGQFKEQLGALMRSLAATAPHFIRCIKASAASEPNRFEPANVLTQLRYGGVLEAVKIAQLGYPSRMPFADFVERFRPLAPRAVPASAPASRRKEDCRALVAALGVDAGAFQLGKTKAGPPPRPPRPPRCAASPPQVFLRFGQLARLEERRDRAFFDAAAALQATFRGRKLRRAFLRVRNAAIAIQSAGRARAARLALAALRRAHRAARGLQAVARMRACRRVLLRATRAAAAIAASWKGSRARRSYAVARRRHAAARRIQRRWRSITARVAWTRFCRRVVSLQTESRGWLARRALAAARRAAGDILFLPLALRANTATTAAVKQLRDRLLLRNRAIAEGAAAFLGRALEREAGRRQEAERRCGARGRELEALAERRLEEARGAEARCHAEAERARALSKRADEARAHAAALEAELKAAAERRREEAHRHEEQAKELRRKEEAAPRGGGGERGGGAAAAGGGGGGAGGAGAGAEEAAEALRRKLRGKEELVEAMQAELDRKAHAFLSLDREAAGLKEERDTAIDVIAAAGKAAAAGLAAQLAAMQAAQKEAAQKQAAAASASGPEEGGAKDEAALRVQNASLRAENASLQQQLRTLNALVSAMKNRTRGALAPDGPAPNGKEAPEAPRETPREMPAAPPAAPPTPRVFHRFQIVPDSTPLPAGAAPSAPSSSSSSSASAAPPASLLQSYAPVVQSYVSSASAALSPYVSSASAALSPYVSSAATAVSHTIAPVLSRIAPHGQPAAPAAGPAAGPSPPATPSRSAPPPAAAAAHAGLGVAAALFRDDVRGERPRGLAVTRSGGAGGALEELIALADARGRALRRVAARARRAAAAARARALAEGAPALPPAGRGGAGGDSDEAAEALRAVAELVRASEAAEGAAAGPSGAPSRRPTPSPPAPAAGAAPAGPRGAAALLRAAGAAGLPRGIAAGAEAALRRAEAAEAEARASRALAEAARRELFEEREARAVLAKAEAMNLGLDLSAALRHAQSQLAAQDEQIAVLEFELSRSHVHAHAHPHPHPRPGPSASPHAHTRPRETLSPRSREP
eukprot:tig00000241_g20880.t1